MANDSTRGIDSGNLYITVITWVILGVFNLAVILINQNNFFTRCCCATNRLLGITNRAAYVSRSTPPRTYWAWDLLDARHLVTGVVHPAVLFLYRLLILAFFAFTVIWQVVGPLNLANRPEDGGSWLTYFTNWTFVLLGLYGVLGTIITWKEVRRRCQRAPAEATSEFTFWDKSFLLVAAATGTAAITLVAFYWGLIYKKSDGFKIDNIFRHGVNVGVILLDILISRVPIVTYHFQAATMYGTAYLVFMWVLFVFNDKWRYTSLDGTKPKSITAVVGLCILLVLSFTILYLVAGLRELLRSGKCCCMCFPKCGTCCQEEEGAGDEEEAMKRARADESGLLVRSNGSPSAAHRPHPSSSPQGQFMAG